MQLKCKTICGLAVAYMYFNRKKPLSVSASLIPLFGDRITTGFWAELIDTLAVLGIALGLSASLGAGLTLVGAGLEVAYGIKQGPVVWFILAVITTATFSISALVGLDRGIKFCADLNAKLYYVLLIFLFLIEPTLYILRMTTAGMAYWLQNFCIWGLDPIDVGGEALVMWWTLYDWAIWIAYAPLMGIFLAVISYGRTIRQFMIIKWIMPAVSTPWGLIVLYRAMFRKMDYCKK